MTFPIKICCLYCYYEKNDLYKNNFEYFLEHPDTLTMPNNSYKKIDYYLILNGVCSIDLTKYKQLPNVFIINRNNVGFDFGAYSHVITSNILKDKYDYYFFINNSVIGPYKQSNEHWTDTFINLFSKIESNPSVKIVGTSINIHKPLNSKMNKQLIELYGDKPVYSHVQSMFFCISRDYFEFLMSHNFFDYNLVQNEDFEQIIIKKEIGLSQYAINNGWNINCLLPIYKNLNYSLIDFDINKSSDFGDPYFPNCYFEKNIKNTEVVFFKNTRFIHDLSD